MSSIAGNTRFPDSKSILTTIFFSLVHFFESRLLQTLRNDYPYDKKKKKKPSAGANSGKQSKLPFRVHDSEGEELEDEEELPDPGPLMEAEFYRVILDEVRIRFHKPRLR